MRVNRKGKVVDVDIKDKRRCVEYEIHNRRKEKIDGVCSNNSNVNDSVFDSILGTEIDLRFSNKNQNNDVSFNSKLCPYCFGTGRRKAMQMATNYNGQSVRVEDTKVECEHCK